MLTENYLLFAIFMMFNLWAVIAFCVYIIKPLQTRWAIIQARKIVAEGKQSLHEGERQRKIKSLSCLPLAKGDVNTPNGAFKRGADPSF